MPLLGDLTAWEDAPRPLPPERGTSVWQHPLNAPPRLTGPCRSTFCSRAGCAPGRHRLRNSQGPASVERVVGRQRRGSVAMAQSLRQTAGRPGGEAKVRPRALTSSSLLAVRSAPLRGSGLVQATCRLNGNGLRRSSTLSDERDTPALHHRRNVQRTFSSAPRFGRVSKSPRNGRHR